MTWQASARSHPRTQRRGAPLLQRAHIHTCVRVLLKHLVNLYSCGAFCVPLPGYACTVIRVSFQFVKPLRQDCLQINRCGVYEKCSARAINTSKSERVTKITKDIHLYVLYSVYLYALILTRLCVYVHVTNFHQSFCASLSSYVRAGFLQVLCTDYLPVSERGSTARCR